MKLALGTAQFGLDYGIANQQGQIPSVEVKNILAKAKSGGLDTLDTAISYGNSEACLGEVGVSDWKVISKLPAIPDECGDIFEWVSDSVNDSLQRLNVNNLYGLLLHRPQQLLELNGEELFNALEKVKKSGLIQKIGVSIYDPSELDELCSRFPIDIVQAPFNIIDRRMIDSGWMVHLNEKKIELHIRSVFLQGLLLMDSESRPRNFDRWSSLWDKYDAWLEQSNLTSLQACLRYVLSFPEIDKIVIGVDSQNHLEEILKASKGAIPPLSDSFGVDDMQLLNPACW